MAENHPFQIGDEVEVIEQLAATAPPRGYRGVVKAFYGEYICVWFPGWSGGHNLAGRLKHKGGWYFPLRQLRLVEPGIPPLSDEDFEKILA